MAQVQYIGTGRRKSSVARVRLVPGEGKIVINNRDIEDYVPFETLRSIINQPLVATETIGSYDILCKRKWWWITQVKLAQSVMVSLVHYLQARP